MDNDNTKHLSNLFKTCFSMPKIELHAHLTGSVRIKTVYDLLENEKDKESFAELCSKQKSLDDCFNMFVYIFKILTSMDVVSRITREMLEDWAKLNCLYIEIRTTLKSIGDKSKFDNAVYVLKEMVSFHSNKKINPNEMQSRLILSFSRNKPLSDALDTIEVFKQLKSTYPELAKLVVGVDYSGLEGKDLLTGSELYDVLKMARELGLKAAVHIGEVKDYIKWDFDSFVPDRFGHTDYLTEEDSNKIIELNIPYECCPSSSYNRLGFYSYKNVNLAKYYKKKNSKGEEYVRFSINTDDTTLFASDLSQEYYEIAAAFEISEEEIRKIAIRVSDDIFDDSYKDELKQRMTKY